MCWCTRLKYRQIDTMECCSESASHCHVKIARTERERESSPLNMIGSFCFSRNYSVGTTRNWLVKMISVVSTLISLHVYIYVYVYDLIYYGKFSMSNRCTFEWTRNVYHRITRKISNFNVSLTETRRKIHKTRNQCSLTFSKCLFVFVNCGKWNHSLSWQRSKLSNMCLVIWFLFENWCELIQFWTQRMQSTLCVDINTEVDKMPTYI